MSFMTSWLAPHFNKAELISRWHRARQDQDQSVSDYITYRKNLEDKIGGISEELRALSLLVEYQSDIREGFLNDHVPLTREAISRIALNVESKNRLKGRNRTREGSPKSQNAKSSSWRGD
jgi:hypothetical protein